MRHGSHGASNIFDFCAGREGLGSGIPDIFVEVGDEDDNSNQDQKEEDRPAIHPNLRESGTEAEVRSNARSSVGASLLDLSHLGHFD